jgi:hypothetical protein
MMTERVGFKGLLDILERSPGGEWQKIREAENLIVNTGYNAVAHRLTGSGAYSGTSFPYFFISDGTEAITLTRTAADFLADGTTFAKAAESYETFSTALLMQQWNCFLATTENTVASIKKFMLGNAAGPTVMFNEVSFDTISKDASKEFYFRYKLYMGQG